MQEIKSVLVVCIDRDGDFERKAGIVGPIVGKKDNINAAAKLAVIDPEDSDSNTVFAAVQKFEEVKKLYPAAEVATLVGKSKFGLESDKKINEQLDSVMEKFPADGIVLVTDGAEDDSVIPILQSRAKIISKKTVIIKQAREVEGTYYAIKEALKDPFLAKVAFGVPGIILLILIAVPSLGLQIVLGAIGAFLIVYGFGIWDKAIGGIQTIAKSINTQRSSFPFYIATLFVFAFGIANSYLIFVQSNLDEISAGIEAAMALIFLTIVSAELYMLGKSIDMVHLKKAFYLRKYLLSGVSLLLLYFILDSAKRVFIGQADLFLFLITIASSFAIFLAVYKASNVMDVTKKITKLLVGVPVYNKQGRWIGKVSAVDSGKESIEYALLKGSKEALKAKKTEFQLKEGKIVLSA